MRRAQRLRRRISVLLLVFMGGLVLSGLTAFPLETELRWLTAALGADAAPAAPARGHWCATCG